MKKDAEIMITKDGPYLISGSLPIDKQIIGIGKEGGREITRFVWSTPYPRQNG